MKFVIHYLEKGHGKNLPSGIVYNGSRRMTLTAKDQEAAIKKLRGMYVKDGIKEITRVDVVAGAQGV